MPDTKHIGRKIRIRREKLGWSLEYAAEKCNLSVRGLNNIELGKSDPHFSTVIKITNALDMDWNDLESCRQLYR